jgi:hypothetical protein
MLTGQADPTIIPPPQYRKRFSIAMERYFMTVPDKWIAYDRHQVSSSSSGSTVPPSSGNGFASQPATPAIASAAINNHSSLLQSPPPSNLVNIPN